MAGRCPTLRLGSHQMAGCSFSLSSLCSKTLMRQHPPTLAPHQGPCPLTYLRIQSCRSPQTRMPPHPNLRSSHHASLAILVPGTKVRQEDGNLYTELLALVKSFSFLASREQYQGRVCLSEACCQQDVKTSPQSSTGKRGLATEGR